MRKIFRCQLCGQIHRHTEFDYDPLKHKDPTTLRGPDLLDYAFYYGLNETELDELDAKQRTSLRMVGLD